MSTHKKNRVLLYGYLDLLLFEAKKYDPMLALGIGLQAYAGLREGEVINLTCDRVEVMRGQFNSIKDIELNLTSKAPFWIDYRKKSTPASFKLNQFRRQKVYNDFVDNTEQLYQEHIALLEYKKYDTGKDSPLFLNMYGKPMTVQGYSGRVKKLFYKCFLPALKKTCIKQNSWIDNVAFIEIYEKEYPGAHMFRHWFTMYLLTKAKLDIAEIMRWRNDHNINSMMSYIHESSDLIQLYETSAYSFQEQILDEMENYYEDV